MNLRPSSDAAGAAAGGAAEASTGLDDNKEAQSVLAKSNEQKGNEKGSSSAVRMIGVVAGGSGAAFDLNSELLQQELPDYEVVNFGLYAGLGTTVMLDLCLPELREGDILIFEVELNAQTLVV